MLQIHEKIKAKRLQLGWSEDDIASKIGVNRTTYQYWEKKTPSVDKVRRVALAMGLNEEFFFVNNDEFLSRGTLIPKLDESQNPDLSIISVIKDAYSQVLAEKEARRLDAETRLQKADEEKNRLFNLLERGLNRLLDDSDTILAYQKAWVDLHAEEQHPGDEALQKRMLAKMGRLVGERMYGPLPKGNVEAQGKTSKGKQGQHR